MKTFKILFFEIFFYETLENFSGRQFLIALSVKHVLLVSLASVFVFLSGFFCFVKTIKNSFFMKRYKISVPEKLACFVSQTCTVSAYGLGFCVFTKFFLGENT